jgi:subtilisin family serine protease
MNARLTLSVLSISLAALSSCSSTPAEQLKASPSVLAFNGTKTATLELRGTGSWTVASDQPWLTASPTSGSGNATVTLSVSRAALAAGNYAATVTVTEGSNTRKLPVFMSFPNVAGNINSVSKKGHMGSAPQMLPAGLYVADKVVATLSPGGVAVATGAAIALATDPKPSDGDFRKAANDLATEYKLTVQNQAGGTFTFGANGQDLAALLATLRNDGRVEAASLDAKVSARAMPNDPRYGEQWHYPLIGLPDAWDLTQGSPSIPLAVIDDGADANHPDLMGRIATGYDFITNSDTVTPGQHGTHVAGTMGAATNNGVGVAGVTWTNPIVNLRVLPGGTDDVVNNAILFAAGIAVQNSAGATVTPSQKARVMNLSLGPDNQMCVDIQPSAGARAAVARALAAGTVVVVASGNTNCNTLDDLSLIPGVIAVAAVDRNGARAPYSTAGAELWIAAPGGVGEGPDAILSTDLNASYTALQGTSMAAPHVAGVVGLMLAANPMLTPVDVRQIIAQTAKPIVGADRNTSGSPTQRGLMGHGLIDAAAAVRAAQMWTPGQSNYVAQLVDMNGAVVRTAPVDPGGNYEFADVPVGRYVVRAGSDVDGDGTLGETGELFSETMTDVDEAGDTEVDLDLEQK